MVFEEVQRLRDILATIAPQALQKPLTAYGRCRTPEDLSTWKAHIVTEVLAFSEPPNDPTGRKAWMYRQTEGLVKEYEPDRVFCPLCHAGASAGFDSGTETVGWKHPEGLRRHLVGEYVKRQCPVIEAAFINADQHLDQRNQRQRRSSRQQPKR